MRKLLFALTALISFQLTAQEDPTYWTAEVNKLSETEYELITTAVIDPGWHLYSQTSGADRGPIATTLSFYEVDNKIEFLGINNETGSYAEYSPVWDFNVYQFSDLATFKQKIKVLDSSLKYIVAEVFFMTCDEERCLRPTGKPLIFKLDTETVVPDDAIDIIEKYLDEELDPMVAQAAPESAIPVKESHEQSQEAVSKKKSDEKVKKESKEKDGSLWAIFIAAFIGGLIALLTPCMFPMIPLTVSFFTKQSLNKVQGIRNAILYGVFIIIIYVLLGSAVVAIFGIKAMNELSTSVVFNLLFFAILIVFGLSFLGAFEIRLPQSWANKADEKSSKGGVVGIFFMALALAVISFSCTGPIAGTILFESASEGGIGPIIGMLGFSSAIALPFALFAIFPGWMNSLPKSGGWLNTVKVFLGFLELAFAFKFLSNADLVMQWEFITREVFIVIWIAVFSTLTLYLFGKIKLPHDGPDNHISVGRLMLGIFSLCFTIYLLPGLWGAPLKIISGFPPPTKYSESPYGVGFTKGNSFSLNNENMLPEGAVLGEYDIVTFHDYDKGMAYAKTVNKPVLVDFTGHACVNCRRMEQLVWGEATVLPILRNDIVMISLYVDDRKKLPEDEQIIIERTGKKMRTIGDKWSELQLTKYNITAQPYYAILNASGKDLVEPVPYTPDPDDFENWLQSGIEKFK